MACTRDVGGILIDGSRGCLHASAFLREGIRARWCTIFDRGKFLVSYEVFNLVWVELDHNHPRSALRYETTKDHMLEALQAPALDILASPESKDSLIQRKLCFCKLVQDTLALKSSDEGIEEEAEEAYALIAVEKEIVVSSFSDEVMANLLDISAELSTTVDTQVEVIPNTRKCQFCLPLGSTWKSSENNFRVSLEVDSENDMDAKDEDLPKYRTKVYKGIIIKASIKKKVVVEEFFRGTRIKSQSSSLFLSRRIIAKVSCSKEMR
ncbi:hypothetical protein ACFE04_011588 [Oxalis oulophora]